MTPGRRNLLVLAALVLALVVVGWFLRSTPGASTPTTPTGATSPSGKASGSPSPGASGSAAAKSPTAIHTVAFVGDSFTAGVGASTPAKRFSTLVATAEHWTERNFGHPQTGYAAAGTLGPCATPADACPNYLTQVPAVVAAAPDLVIVSGGGNDVGLDPATVKTDVEATLAGLKTGLPQATIVVVNPWWDMRPQPAGLAGLADTLKTSAAAAGVTWADTGQPIAGHGNLVTPDGLQANDQGHAAMAAAITGALKLAGITG